MKLSEAIALLEKSPIDGECFISNGELLVYSDGDCICIESRDGNRGIILSMDRDYKPVGGES